MTDEQMIQREHEVFRALDQHFLVIARRLAQSAALASEWWTEAYGPEYVRGRLWGLFDDLFPRGDRSGVPYTKRPIPAGLRWEVFERDNFTCKACGRRQMLHADHIIPEIEGGPTILDNLQTLCQRCNSTKGVRPCRAASYASPPAPPRRSTLFPQKGSDSSGA